MSCGRDPTIPAPRKNTHNTVPETEKKNRHQLFVKPTHVCGRDPGLTKNAKRKACPHCGMICHKLCCRWGVIDSLVQGDAKATRLCPKHPIKDDRGDAETDRGPDLRHCLE